MFFVQERRPMFYVLWSVDGNKNEVDKSGSVMFVHTEKKYEFRHKYFVLTKFVGISSKYTLILAKNTGPSVQNSNGDLGNLITRLLRCMIFVYSYQWERYIFKSFNI